MLNLKEGLFIGAIGIATLFSSGCERLSPMSPNPVTEDNVTDKYVTITEGERYEEATKSGFVIQTFGNYLVVLNIEGQEGLEELRVGLKYGYSKNEVEAWKNSARKFTGRLQGNRLTEAVLEN